MTRWFCVGVALLASVRAEADAGGGAMRTSPVARASFGTVAFEELGSSSPDGSLDALQRALPLLEGRGVAIGLEWKAERIDDPARWRIVEEAYSRGIFVHPVLTLPEGSEEDERPGSPRHALTGYFVNATNYAAWIEASKQLMDAWLARGLPPTTMVIDMEMRRRRLLRLAELTARTDVLGTLTLLSGGIDRARQARAIAAFQAYANDAHARGFLLQLTTLLPILDDYRDGDDTLRQAFGVPLADDPRQIPFDVISFQIHRTIYRQRYPGLSSHFVYDYARAAVALVGSRAAVDVGLTHGGIAPDASVYADPSELRADVAAARAAGIPASNILVYSFLGMLLRPPVSAWFEPSARIEVPGVDPRTESSHREWDLIDALLW